MSVYTWEPTVWFPNPASAPSPPPGVLPLPHRGSCWASWETLTQICPAKDLQDATKEGGGGRGRWPAKEQLSCDTETVAAVAGGHQSNSSAYKLTNR